VNVVQANQVTLAELPWEADPNKSDTGAPVTVLEYVTSKRSTQTIRFNLNRFNLRRDAGFFVSQG